MKARKLILTLMTLALVASSLSACVVVPARGYGGYGGHDYHGNYRHW